MRTLTSIISTCRYCQHYSSEGRRGGYCNQLGAPVQGCWKACSLAIPPFAPSWEAAAGIKIWHEPLESLEDELSIACLDLEMSPNPGLESLDILETLAN